MVEPCYSKYIQQPSVGCFFFCLSPATSYAEICLLRQQPTIGVWFKISPNNTTVQSIIVRNCFISASSNAFGIKAWHHCWLCWNFHFTLCSIIQLPLWEEGECLKDEAIWGSYQEKSNTGWNVCVCIHAYKYPCHFITNTCTPPHSCNYPIICQK